MRDKGLWSSGSVRPCPVRGPCVLITARIQERDPGPGPGAGGEDWVTLSYLDSALGPSPQSTLATAAGNTRRQRGQRHEHV